MGNRLSLEKIEMMKAKYYWIILFLVWSNSCSDDSLFNSGVVKTKVIDISKFTTIEVESIFEIELVSDTIYRIYVTGGENLQPLIKTEVKEEVLYLSHTIKNNWSRNYEKVKLKIHTRPFSRINVRKPVKIFNNDIYKGNEFSLVDFGKYCELDMNVDVDNCLVAMSSDNFGRFKVKGNAGYAQIWGWGSCVVRADSLVTGNCYVLHRGIGNVYVNVTGNLDVLLQFSGNIYYKGLPAVINVQDSSGTGKLINF
jgi:hypothetical protein